MVQFQVLGPLRVLDGEKELQPGGPKQRSVLAILLANANQAVSIDRIIDGVWGAAPPEAGRHTVQAYVSSLRSDLGLTIERVGDAYRLSVEAADFDVMRFESLVEEGRSLRPVDPAAASDLLVGALRLWNGRPYADLPGQDIFQSEITRLDELRLAALEERIEADLAAGRHAVVVGELEVATREHPFRERLYALSMLALYRSGRQAEALRVYRRLRELLAEELGIDPAPDLQELEQRILRQDSGLQPAPTTDRTETVAMLFTDFESSTASWEAQPVAMGDLIAKHDLVLAQLVEQHGGRVFKQSGDGALIAFPTVAPAVAVAEELQRRLQDRISSMRMAIDVGEVEARGGDFFGSVLNRCARLLSAADGGQIVLSEQAAAQLDGDRIRDLGEEFPPLRTLELVRNNLPVQLTSFVGRDQQLAEIDKLVRGARLVTLLGAGGCGKTRLAAQVAAQMLDVFPDGVWLVELAPVSEPDLVASSVARAVGVTESVNPLRGLLEVLRSRQTLLLVDNCEHLLRPVSRLVTDCLKAAPGLRVLTTTREPLGVLGEVVFPVPPLSLPPTAVPPSELLRFEAVRLFAERAEAAAPGFQIKTENADSVGLICRLLEGIPLAIELATARLRILSPQEIAAKLKESLSVLGTAPGDEVPHHRTMQATLDWSFQLLSQMEQRLFELLSVFAGGWTLRAAEEVCGGKGVPREEVFDLLAGLVDKSVVVVVPGEGTNRYRLLEPMRHYAHDQLAQAGGDSVVRADHAHHYAQLAEDAFPGLVGPDEAIWWDRLEADIDNIRIALAWHLENGKVSEGQLMAGATWRFWLNSYRWSEGSDWLLRMVEAGPGRGQPRARALLGLGALSYGAGASDGAVKLDEAIALYREFGPQNELGWALNNRGIMAGLLGEWDLAANLHLERLDLARRIGDRLGIIQSAYNLSMAKLQLGDLDEAASSAEETLRLARTAGSAQWLYFALTGAAEVALSQGNVGAAGSVLQEAVDLSRRPDVRVQDVGHALLVMAELSYRTGDYEAARAYLTQHHQAFRNIGYGEPETIAEKEYFSLWLRGEIEIAGGSHHKGVMLIAACIGKFDHLTHEPRTKKKIDVALDHARKNLGDEAFMKVWNEGTAMTSEDALAWALQEGTGTVH